MRYSKFEMVMRQSKVYESRYEYNVSGSGEAYDFAVKIMELDIMPEEHFYSVSLNAKGDVVGFCEVSKGSVDEAHCGAREVFRTAIMQNATAVVLFHNHPSGDAAPSDADIASTKRLIEAGEIIGIKVVDHLIIGDGGYSSVFGFIS